MAATAAAYDPLKLPGEKLAAPVDLTVHDAKRDRDIPVRVFLPAASSPAPVVIFSHGLGGSREGSPYLGEHWAARGYAVVYLQHAGSDTAVWKDVPPDERMAALKKAASAQNLILRLQDVPAVLDQLAVWNKESGNPLAGRLDLDRIGMSGHSFGAGTTQGVSGQTFPSAVGRRFTDARIRAAVAFSPSAPSTGDRAGRLRRGHDSLDADDRHEGRLPDRQRDAGVAPGRFPRPAAGRQIRSGAR